MRTAQPGDRVEVHFVKRFQDGSVVSSRGRTPLELTVGTPHPRLPGVGLALVGLAPGESATLRLPPDQAYGPHDPGRVRQMDRRVFKAGQPLAAGKWLRVLGRRGRRWVRVVEVRENQVVVDLNRRGAGQTLELEVKVVAIHDAEAGRRPGRAVAFDLDALSLDSLRQALPGWQVDAVAGATVATLERDWNPVTADLLIVGAGGTPAETLGLCRGLRSQAGRARTPLLVLVRPGQEALVRAALEAGASNCLVLPVHPKQLASLVAHPTEGDRPGRHTLDLDPARPDDRWRDVGGQG
jgi:peptidylprolyl isomerase